MSVRRGASIALCGLVSLLFLAAPTPQWTAAAELRPGGTVANGARLAGDRERTRFIADLSAKVDVHVFALSDPYRVIVDLPEVNFQMPAGLGKDGRGLITGFRYGLFAPGKSRIVIDVSGPFLIDKAFVLDARENQPARLVVDLTPTDRATFLSKLHDSSSANTEDDAPPPAAAPQIASKPVIVIDPGHGGVDPGTSSADGVLEKDVVLAFAKTLKARLEATGNYDIYLTRNDDTFLPLRQRVAFAEGKGANLFLSVHADSFPHETAQPVGATVYTLSEEASDDEAKELAAKENLSDAIAGMELPKTSDGVVANILIDLAQRETQNRSLFFAGSVAGGLRGRLHSRSPKSAGFRVLKSPDIPSVLLEIGFLSNAEDEKRLTSETWRETMAGQVVKSVDIYFTKRLARMPY